MDQQTKQELFRRWSERRARTIYGMAVDPTGEDIATWIIDIVADARELELSETMAALRGRIFGDIETSAIRMKPVEQATPMGVARLEAVRAFAAAHGGEQAEFETDLARLARTLELGLVWSDGSATVTTAEGQALVITAGAVMVVKPDPEPQVISLTDQEHPTVVVKP